MGWDGKLYTAIASDFENFATKGTVDRFYYKRTFPSAVVYYGHKVLGIEYSIQSIITGFYFMNLLLIVLGMFLWHKTLDHFNISFWNRLVAFLGVFGGYAIAKHGFYYPVLTDTTALFLSIAMLYAYLKEKYWMVFIASAIGAFTFPTLFLMGTILLVFPKTKMDEAREAQNHIVRKILPWLIPALYGAFITYLWFSNEFFVVSNGILTVLAAVANLLFLIWVSQKTNWDSLINVLKNFNKKWVVITISFFVLTAIIVHFFARSEGFTLYEFVSNMTEHTGFTPFLFGVAHVVYYGPIILLALIFYKGFLKNLDEQPVGILVLITVYLFFAINPSSRQLIGALPFVALVLIQALEKEKLSKKFYWAFIVLTALFSRVWFTINAEEFTGDPSQFPDQRYFMADGLYTTVETYLIQGGVVIIAGILLWLFSSKRLYS